MRKRTTYFNLCQFLIFFLLTSSCNQITETDKAKKKEKTESSVVTKYYPSKIDSLKNNSEIENLIRSKGSKFNKFELRRIQDFDRDIKTDSLTKLIANKLKITEAFYKTDFDNNGYTDILAIGDNNDCFSTKPCSFNSIVLMNFENDSIKIVDIVRERSSSFVPTIKNENGQSLLVINNPDQISWKNVKYKDGSINKLVYKNGGFIEFNPNPKTQEINSIEFLTTPCFGTCPVFKLNINDKRESTFVAEHYNFEVNYDEFNEDGEGTFKTIISNEKYQEIIELINYLDFENLENDYWVNWTDDQSSSLKVIYNGGKVKTIKDYGLIGSYGLKRLYELLFDLRFNQKWQEVNTTDNTVYN